MTTVTLCSLVGAPGVSTTALALAWVWPEVTDGRQVLLVDADPAGSALRDACPVHLAPEAGLISLAAESLPPDTTTLLRHAVEFDDARQRYLLPGVALPTQARSVAPIWPAVLEAARDLHVLGMDVIVDAGRWGHALAPTVLVHEADEVLLIVEPTARASLAAAITVRELTAVRAPRSAPRVALRDSGPYTATEVTEALAAPVHVLANDARAAHLVLDRPGTRPDRSALWRSVRSMATALVAGLPAEVMW